MSTRALRWVRIALVAAAAPALWLRPALAQIPDSSKIGKSGIYTQLQGKQTKRRGLDSLVLPPKQGAAGGTADGPVGAVQQQTVIYAAPPPCGDADTVQVGGRTDTVEVPNLVGLRENDAHILLGKRHLWHRSREVAFNRATGIVFAQATPPGTRVAPETWLKLCWAGPTEVPDVVHRPQAEAARLLEEAGYRPVEETAETLTTELVGKVTRQDPPAHARADSGAAVTITLGVLRTVQVPQVVGLSRAAAEASIGSSNLIVRARGATSDSAVVQSQLPPAHARVDAWTPVDLTLVVPATTVREPKPPQPIAPSSQPTSHRTPWILKVALALAATAAAAGVAHEVRSRRRIRSIQIVPVRDDGSQTLAAREDGDPELRGLDLELRPIVDSGVQQIRLGNVPAGKERARV